MNIIKRILKGILIWFVAMLAMYLIFSTIYPSGTDMPVFFSFFILLFPIFCAVRFSRAKKKDPQPTGHKSQTNSSLPKKPVTQVQVYTPQPPRPTDMSRIDKMEGHEFEAFTAELLRKLGYENVRVTRGSGDQGVDVLAVKNGKTYGIQCKRYNQKLGNKPVQEVFAGKAIYGCSVAVVLTNNYFTDGAKEAARATGVELWDRDTLQRMLVYAEEREKNHALPLSL